jgi:hypothetical protein
MAKMQDSILDDLKYAFTPRAWRKAEDARRLDENVLDTDLRMFFLKAGMPQAVLHKSRLKENDDGVTYRIQAYFIGGKRFLGGMTQDDAVGIAQKMVDSGIKVLDAGTTFEYDDRNQYGYMNIEMAAKSAAELQGKLETMQKKYAVKRPAEMKG